MAKNKIRFVQLGALNPLETQMVYEAVATAQSRENVKDTIIICWPEGPLVCVGYHQVVKEEIDVEYCRRHNIPIVRRVIGGGAVYLNKDQVFYQYIFNEGSPNLPKTFADFYKVFLNPVVKTYNDFKVPAIFRPVNDIEANGKKVSGTGAGTFENSRILTGNFLMDFDYKTMTKVLKVPDEKFRDKIYKSLTERLSTFNNILGYIPRVEDVVEKYKLNLEKSLDIELIEEKLSEKENKILKSLYKKYRDPKWVNLFEEERSELLNRSIKIAKDTGIAKSMYKAPGGLIKILFEIEDMRIKDILINGDFFIYPEDSLRELENILKDNPYQLDEILGIIDKFYEKNEIESPGVKPEDFIETLKNSNLHRVVG